MNIDSVLKTLETKILELTYFLTNAQERIKELETELVTKE